MSRGCRRRRRRRISPSAATASSRRCASVFDVWTSLSSGAAAARIAESRQRADGLDRNRAIRIRDQRKQRRLTAGGPSSPQALGGEGARVRTGILEQREQRWQRPRILEPLQRERHGPPSHARLPGPSSTAPASGIVSLQAGQRVDAEPERSGRRVARDVEFVRRQLGERARLDRISRRHASHEARPQTRSPMSPSASAALPFTSGAGSASAATSGSRALLSPIRPSANAAICRTSGSASASSAHQRLHTIAQTDAADRQRGAATDARLLVGEQARQIRHGGGGGGGGGHRDAACRAPAPVAARRGRWRLRSRIAQHARDPRAGGSTTSSVRSWWSGGRGGGGWRGAGAAARAEREQQRERRTRHAAMISSGALQFRYIAVEGPIGAGKTALAERLATRLDATLVLEDTENPFLADFYADRPGAALQAQLFYLLGATGSRQRCSRPTSSARSRSADYLFDKDKIFAYLNLDDNELFIYQRLYDLLARDVPPPDLVIYLQAPTDVLLRRIAGRRTDTEVDAFEPDAGVPARN